MSDKEILRLEIKRRLSQISEHDFHQLNALVDLQFNHFLNHFSELKTKTIGAYLPMKRELNICSLSKLRVAYPMQDNEEMKFGIAHAPLTEKIWLESAQEIVVPDWYLVPGLGFDLNGHRLGRGKGFYDRYLAEHKGLKVALALSMQLEEKILTEDHDVRMDFIITESFCWDVAEQKKI